MSQYIQIETKHFIGQGEKAWLIVGRIPGDDDDTALLILADDPAAAQEIFMAQLFDDADTGEHEISYLRETYGAKVIVTDIQLLN